MSIVSIISGAAAKASGGDFVQGALSAMVVWLYNDVTAILNTKEEKLYVANNDLGEYIIVEAFSGGELDKKGKVHITDNGKKQIPIPKGKYYIIDNPNPNGHNDWFGLIKIDNRIDDYTGGFLGFFARGGFRLHPGSLSWGCVTVKITQENAVNKWKKLRQLILKTKTFKIDFIQGPHFWNPTITIETYGILEVQ